MSESDPIEPAWAEVEDAWEDEAVHRKFLTLCAATDRLAEAGRRYRQVKETDPERAAMAERQIDRVLGMAMQSLSALKTERPRRSGRTVLFLIAVVVSLTLVVTALWTMLRWM